MMKHVYVLDEDGIGSIYGINTYICNLLKIFPVENFSITVFKLYSKETILDVVYDKHIRYIYVPDMDMKYKNDYYYRNIFYLILPYINPEHYNILHLNYRSCIDLAYLLKYELRFKILLVWHYQTWIDLLIESDVDKVLSNKVKRLSAIEEQFCKEYAKDNELLKCCDGIILLADHSYLRLNKMFDLKTQRIFIVNNGIEDKYVSNINRDTLKVKFEFDVSDKIVLYVGRLDSNKNPSVLISAFDKLKQCLNNLKLVIVGQGNFRQPLSILYPRYKNIIFTGFLEQEQLSELYRIADLGVIPSHYEEFGYVATEMLMYGIPIISNKSSGLSDVIGSDLYGDLIDLYRSDNQEDSINLLASSMARLLLDQDRRVLLSKNARLRYLEKFSIDIFKQKMIEVYNAI